MLCYQSVMAEPKTEKKFKKNLFLPDWIIELLDSESLRYGGPGVVSSSAILAFSRLTDEEKAEQVKRFRSEEVDRAYSIVESAAEAEKTEKKQRRGKHSQPKSA